MRDVSAHPHPGALTAVPCRRAATAHGVRASLLHPAPEGPDLRDRLIPPVNASPRADGDTCRMRPGGTAVSAFARADAAADFLR